MPYFPPQQTAIQILNKLKTVDGSGSGLDADTIDGLHANEISTVAALNDLTDVTISTPSTNQVLLYNGSIWVNGTITGGVTDHGDLTGLADDDHTQYLIATGARTGATSSRQVFTSGITTGSIRPSSDSTTSLQLQKADGTAIITIDTTNRKVILNGYLLVDRWLGSSFNLFLGDGVAGAGNLAHTTGATGWYNVGLGYESLRAITSGNGNMAVGANALISITTGSSNMAVGKDASTTLTTGSSNVAIGASAGNFGTSGFGNIAIGASVASGAATSNYNIGIGYNALGAVANSGNIAIGQLAGTFLRTSSNNTIIGTQAGQGTANYNVSNNIFIGYQAGYSITTNGSNNLFIGYQSGDSVTTGANNLLIGYGVDVPTATTSYYLNIGNLFTGDLTAGALKHGFFGVTPVLRQLVPTGSSIDTVITALQNLGLFKQS